MPSADLFEPRDEAGIRDALDTARNAEAKFDRELFSMSVDYLEGRQLSDVEAELNSRYERTQSGDRGGQIAAQTMPLTQRYVSEAANAYNRPVTRTLHNEDGTPDEQTTAELTEFLEECSYDETMHRNDQYTVLLQTNLVWYQSRAGKLRPTIVWPHDVWPIQSPDDWASVADQSDYAAHVVQLTEDGSSDNQNRYAWLEPAQTAFFCGETYATPDSDGLTRYDNVFAWPQTVDGETPLDGETRTLPLQMLTYWHSRLPVGELVIDNDPAIAIANRELNLQLSILLDTLAHQGWATLLVNLMNPDAAPSTFSAGPRNGIALTVEESATLLSSPVNYTDLVNVLSQWSRLLAIAMRQSPNDFSTQATAAQSGFAKLVDSLPKIEARSERTTRLKATEARVAWPRIGAVGSALGRFTKPLEQLSRLTLHTEFAPLEFPTSVDERTREEEHDIRHGLTTAAKILAKRRGISIDEAEAEVNLNLGVDPEADADAAAAGAAGADDVQKTALNGAQTASMVQIVTAIAAKQIPREAGIQMMITSFRVPREEAEALVGSAGDTFFAAKEDQAQPKREPPEPPAQPANQGPVSRLGSLIAGRRRAQ